MVKIQREKMAEGEGHGAEGMGRGVKNSSSIVSL